MLVAFFFPIATLCGVFGTNLKHGLEDASWPLPFVVVVSMGLLLGAVLKTLVTRRPTDLG
jgi:Mg2+ and Co2+ transporter CorA